MNDTDVEIQNKIGQFNQLRSQLSVEMQKPDKDGEKMTALDTRIRELYMTIMAMPKIGSHLTKLKKLWISFSAQ